MYFYCFEMICKKLKAIFYYQRKVTTTTGTGHLPSKDLRESTILIDGALDISIIQLRMTMVGRSKHTREHSYLRME